MASPAELQQTIIAFVKKGLYADALARTNELLRLEPSNALAHELKPVLEEKIALDLESESESDDDDDNNEVEGDATESGVDEDEDDDDDDDDDDEEEEGGGATENDSDSDESDESDSDDEETAAQYKRLVEGSTNLQFRSRVGGGFSIEPSTSEDGGLNASTASTASASELGATVTAPAPAPANTSMSKEERRRLRDELARQVAHLKLLQEEEEAAKTKTTAAT